MLKTLFLALLALNFTAVDKAYDEAVTPTQHASYKADLEKMLPQASSASEKADVLWRLSRACYMLGDTAQEKEEKRAYFTEGISYAEKATAANPSNEQGLVWRCANAGGDALTRGLPAQVKAVSQLTKDFSTVLDKLGKTSCTAAWYGLAEVYWRHPFKPSDVGVNYARKAAVEVPAKELNLNTYYLLASILYKRNWTKEERAQARKENIRVFASATSNTEKYGAFDGATGAEAKLPWGADILDTSSDREEAAAVISYALQRYHKATRVKPEDKESLKKLQNLQKKMK